ncbi:hypothetical protein C8Q73DRAFT_793074 [Cubamyces lactineus]|nr:hypothetical protein C8Q73DRAFT_793074 [Cubamyces lactineus]
MNSRYDRTRADQYINAAVAALRDPTLSPGDAANQVIALCRQAVVDADPADFMEPGDTPGLSYFMECLWGRFLEIVVEDPTSHDHIIAIIAAIEAKGTEGCDGWQTYSSPFDWANLPLLRLEIRESMNGPEPAVADGYYDPLWRDPNSRDALAGDPPTDSPPSRTGAHARSRWLNLNRFLARAWELGALDFAFYGMAFMRGLEAFTQPPEARQWSITLGIDDLEIETVAIWLCVAGGRIYECRVGGGGDRNWGAIDDIERYHPDRWAQWKSILVGISNGGGRQNMVDAAKAAVEAMEASAVE